MASQSAIAEGGVYVSADQINYEQKLFSHPSYKFEPQFPNTFGQTISLSSSSQTPVTITIPPEVFNLSESLVNYTTTLPAGANYTWVAQQALREMSHIQYFAGSNQYISDIDNLQNYLDITLKKELSSDEFQSLDLSLNGIGSSNSPINVAPALRNSNMTSVTVDNGPAYQANINYQEPAYFQVSANATAVTYNVQFPLRLIKNSIFSINKNLYMGQSTYLKLYFGPASKVAYASTSNNNPNAGIKSAYIGAGTISNLQLMLAVESNQEMRTKIINTVSTTGLSYRIPYVQAFKNSNMGGSQNISIQFDQGNGKSLVKVYHAPYNNNEQLETMYDHCNTSDYPTAAGGVTAKVQAYYTQLNGKRLQDITIYCTNPAASVGSSLLDYMSHKKQLRGSILQNANVYQYSWFHCDDFADFGPNYDKDNSGELVAGIPLSVAPLTWAFVGINMTSLTFQHYTWAVFIKRLIMTPSTVTVD